MSTSSIPHTEETEQLSAAHGSRLTLALEILELYREGVPALTSEEIAQRVGVPLTSAIKVVEKLSSLGYLKALADSQTYWPTTRLDWIRDSIDRPAFSPPARRLPPPADPSKLTDLFAGQQGAVVAVGVRNGLFIQHIAYWASDERVDRPVDAQKLYLAPLGFALLWAETDPVKKNLMDQIASGATAAQLARLYHAFTELDEQGYLLGGENGGAELAAPVKRDGFVVGAISCVIAGATATGSGQLLRRAARTVAESMFPQN